MVSSLPSAGLVTRGASAVSEAADEAAFLKAGNQAMDTRFRLEIEGILQKPQSALVLERKKANFNPLIKLRTDWQDAMEQSVDEIK